MYLKKLGQRPGIQENPRINEAYIQFDKLLVELGAKDLPDKIINAINQEIDLINAIPDSGKELKNTIKKKQAAIIKLIEKELKLVPKNYYKNTWTALGLSVFGIPIGTTFGLIFDNMAFLGLGLPIGLAVGIAVGKDLDKKASKEGRQLDIEIKY